MASIAAYNQVIERFGTERGIPVTVHALTKKRLREKIENVGSASLREHLMEDIKDAGNFSFGHYVTPDAARDYKHHEHLYLKP